MRIKLLIATLDTEYAEHLSSRISARHTEAIDISVCSSPESLQSFLSARKFDAALLEPSLARDADLSNIHLPLLLWEEDENTENMEIALMKIRKYQRISSIVAEVLEKYAKVSSDGCGFDPDKAHITAVWSPAGGVGKTSVALAYAAKKISEGKQVLYLNFEQFSSVPVYFTESGKSISAVFEMLENHEGNVKMLIQGIRRYDSNTGVAYFCRPDNFDDMNILSTENVTVLVDACAGATDELVIDMSCVCDERARQIFGFADQILLVTDTSIIAQIKLSQFTSQHHIFERIKDKAVLVANKGAETIEALTDTVISLPFVQSADVSAVYHALSGYCI